MYINIPKSQRLPLFITFSYVKRSRSQRARSKNININFRFVTQSSVGVKSRVGEVEARETSRSLIMNFWTGLIGGLIAFLLSLALYVKRSQTYWSRNGVPFIRSASIFGNVENPFRVKDGLLIRLKKCHEEFSRRKEKYGGIYFFIERIFMPIDTDLIKNILTKDFAHFHGHGFTVNEKVDPLAAHLFNLQGEKWRNMRVRLSPTFTSGKMKMMFQTLVDCGIPLIEHIDGLSRSGENLDVKEILACYTTDIIGSCAFGVECNSFRDPDAKFRSYGRKMFAPRLINIFLQFVSFVSPAFVIKSLPIKRVPIEVEKFFIGIIRNIMDYRANNKVRRNDFIQLFLEIQEQAIANGTQPLTIEQISAQAFGFFQAGFETSSTTMTFCLHELAFNQDIQDELREEIREALKRNNGRLRRRHGDDVYG